MADTDAEAERLFAGHVENFYNKSLHIAPHFSMTPGYVTKRSLENMLARSGSVTPFGVGGSPRYAECLKSGAVICGSPETVADQLAAAVKDLHIGHLIALMQIQSMPTELTKQSTQLFADKVLPKIRQIWDGQGYTDHWWPYGATRGTQPEPAAATAGESA